MRECLIEGFFVENIGVSVEGVDSTVDINVRDWSQVGRRWTHERLASCSSTLWRVRWSSENQVEFGSGFVRIAKSNRNAEMFASKLTALKSPSARSFWVMYLPVRGRKP